MNEYVEFDLICMSIEINGNKPFDKRSTLSKRPSTVDRNESKFANGAANP